MHKFLPFILILFLCSSCLQMEPAPNRGPSSLPPMSYENATIRWSNDFVSRNNLNLLISADFNADEKTDIVNIIKTWNTAHDDLSFIGETPSSTPNINTNDLNVYRDSILGIYKSYNWFSELSSRALGVTQFYATKRNAGSEDEYLEITHADIIINFRDYNFNLADMKYSGYDLYSIILHEMGHFLGLKHTRHIEDVMSPYLDTGEKKRSLSPNDINLLNDLYTKTVTSLSTKKAVSGPKASTNANDEIIRGIIELMPCGCQKARFEKIKRPII